MWLRTPLALVVEILVLLLIVYLILHVAAVL